MKTVSLSVVALFLLTAGCGPKTPVPAVAPTVTINEIMKGQVTMAYNAASNAPSEITDPDTPEGKAAAGNADADWKAIRDGALSLSEAMALITMEGRKVAPEGLRLENEGQPGYLTATQMQAGIAANRAKFLAHAKEMDDAAKAIVAAVDARNVDAMFDGQGKVEAACSSCHLAFWYPESK